MNRQNPSAGPNAESEGLYTTLVAGLAHSLVPSTIMGLTLVTVGAFAYSILESLGVLAATCIGGLASSAKVALVALHRRRLRRPFVGLEEARIWEIAHLVTTCAVASSVGALGSGLFARSDESLHMLATGVVFGYGLGIVARIFIRPRIAMAALLIAALPTAASAFAFGATPDRILAVILLAFLGAGLESVRYLYNVSAAEIASRLQMGHLARTDALTGLANRFVLQEAAQWFDVRREGFTAVHCFDLDAFKSINDQFGHDAGDDLLREVASRLRTFLAEGDLAIRTGGDEFVVLQMALERADDADVFAGQLVEVLTQPYPLSGRSVRVGVSHGYAVSPAGAASLDALMRSADAASYRAKWRGGGLEQAVWSAEPAGALKAGRSLKSN
ncbi:MULTISPECIES: GGDEF domain-containing protein [unclassified Aureimonas]|uniref:GGDEF domain-containing protein n=1 Tax=unclassified Aureimonas TaxID=2615206 RepID=UPI0007229B25|nr:MULTISPECIES: GGDEF domain-containing protein [unclassified Aureimonas]ALN71698.1 hypothetical protein M673_03175 [Aureimonas sp. AU20]